MFGCGLGCPRWGNGAWRRALAALCVASVLISPVAQAQEKDELARRHFESGAAYFAEAEYEDALKAFRKAYELSNRPEILLNIAVVDERMGRLNEAVEALNEYLLKNPDAPEIETVRLRRDNLAKRAETEPQAQTAAEKSRAGEKSKGADASAGEPGSQPNAAEDTEPKSPNHVPAYVALSLGALTGIGAAITGLGAQAEFHDLEDRCATRKCDADDTSSGRAMALSSTVLTGVSIVSVGVGVWLWFANSPPANETVATDSGAPEVNVRIGAQAGFAQARWRF
jgi:Tetratricopeptide repeat